MEKWDENNAEFMELLSNKAAKEIVHYLAMRVNDPMASVISLVKASAILLEAVKDAGEDDKFLESIILNTLKPAREEVRTMLFQNDEEIKVGN